MRIFLRLPRFLPMILLNLSGFFPSDNHDRLFAAARPLFRARRNFARPQPCHHRPRAPRVGRRDYRRSQGVRHVEHLSRARRPFRRGYGFFRRRGPVGLRGVRASGPYLCPRLQRPRFRRNHALQRPYHLQFRRSVRAFRPAGPHQRHFVRPAHQPRLFARRNRPLQSLRRRVAARGRGRAAGRTACSSASRGPSICKRRSTPSSSVSAVSSTVSSGSTWAAVI